MKLEDIKSWSIKIGTSVIVSVIAYVVVQALVKNTRRGKVDNNPDDPVSYLVQRYRQAMNPSGISWLIGADGTDETEIFDLGVATKGRLKEVQLAYKAKYNTTLTDALSKELDPEEYQKWYNAAA